MAKNAKMARKQNNAQSGRITTTVPAARGQVSRNTNPRMMGGMSSTVVKHRELIANPSSVDVFEQKQLSINAGYQPTFPWLGKVAGAYELYRFKRLSFEYVPQVATTTNGTVGMYFDYDPTDGVATSIVQFSNMYQSKIAQIWQGFKITVECPAKTYFTRNGVPSDDLKLYDIGTFNYFVETTTLSTGLFYIDYEIELLKPHNHLDTTLYAEDVGYGRWGSASTGVEPSASPGVKDNKFVWGEGANAGKFQVPVTGDYQVETACITPNGANITKICDTNRIGPVSTVTNMVTNVQAIIGLFKNTWYTPLTISAGVVGANTIFQARLLRAT